MHSHGWDMGWPWGFANWCSPNDTSLGMLGWTFTAMSTEDAKLIMWVQTLVCDVCTAYIGITKVFFCILCISSNSKLVLHYSDRFDGSTIDTIYSWLGVALFFFKIGSSFYQPCNTLPTVINKVFPDLADHKICGDLHELPSAVLHDKLPTDKHFEPDKCGHVNNGAIQGPKYW